MAYRATKQISSGVTATSATYYDGWGRAVETVTPAFSSGSTYTYSVRYTMYDGSGRKLFVSDPYFVTTSSATPAYQRPDTAQAGTQYGTATHADGYDGLGRVLLATDPLGNLTTTSYSVGQPASGANLSDTNLYAVTTVVDANRHQHRTLVDGLGHTRYGEQHSGNGAGTAYALYGTTRQDYDWLGAVTALYEPNDYPTQAAGLSASAQTTITYDLIGQATGSVDADRGTLTQAFDPDGALTETTDPRGASGGTTYSGYDGLDRPIWRNTTNSPTGAYATYTYDQTDSAHGDGVGRLTHTTFSNANAPTGSPAMRGSYDTLYDARGQTIGVTQGSEGNPSADTLTSSYNDAGEPTSLVYSDNEVLTSTYNSAGRLTDLATQQGGVTTNLATNITYSGVGGAAGQPTGASMANGTSTYAASDDNDLRLQSDSLSMTSGGLTLDGLALGYDGVGDVTSANTTLAVGTDNQAFCYNERNQLTWAGSTGAPACGSSLTPGSLTAANYSQAMSYDALGRLASLSTAGSYSYGDAAHVHAATAISGAASYTAAYDAAGNMTCRAPSSAATCADTPTGQVLSYDNAGQLTRWASAPSGSVSSASFLYDGAGQRVEQRDTPSGGATTTTRYLFGGLEEDTGGVITKYFGVAGLPSAMRVGTNAVTYLTSDKLGSVSEALDGAGNVLAAQLYAPYGGVRYSTGSMPTAKGFTGQRADGLSGLDYYGARYYDPAAGQFTSADTVADGLSPYAYVRGNPETNSDPSGHRYVCPNCGGADVPPPPTPTPSPVPTPVSTPVPTPTPSGSGSQACGSHDTVCHIQKIAGDTANGFQNASNTAVQGMFWLGVAAAVSGILSAILGLSADVPLTAPMAEFAIASAYILVILDYVNDEASKMHDMFAQEQTESQFSIASLEQLRSEASTTTLEHTSAFLTAYSALVAFAINVMPTLTFKSPAVEAVATAALSDAIGATADAIIVSESMNQYANDTIDQQEQYLQ